MVTRIAGCISVAILPVLIGCSSRPARVGVPAYDPNQIGVQAVELFDRDGDGSLSAEELRHVKSLESAIERVDANGDKKITSEEIAARIRHYQEHRAGLLSVYCTLTKGGRPLRGAKVTYEPEKFMGDTVEPAYGATDDSGRTLVSIAREHLPSPSVTGVRPGFYRIRVTLADGKDVSKLDAGVEAGSGLLNNHSFVVP